VTDHQSDYLRMLIDDESDDLFCFELCQKTKRAVLGRVEQPLDHLVAAAALPRLEQRPGKVNSTEDFAVFAGRGVPELFKYPIEGATSHAAKPSDLLGHRLDFDLFHVRQETGRLSGADSDK